MAFKEDRATQQLKARPQHQITKQACYQDRLWASFNAMPHMHEIGQCIVVPLYKAAHSTSVLHNLVFYQWT